MKQRIGLMLACALVLGACGGGGDDSASTAIDQSAVERGIEIYAGTCSACHGQAGEGIEGLGKPWVNSEFINSRTDQEMLEFLIEGRPSDHPDNTTGISMMPRGGNPNLTDDDLLDLVAYMRTLNL